MEESNKRIAKNTLYLYVRMFVIMALSFITTRVVLDKLGASDYGIYTLVGGFVAMFVVLNNILSASTRRFLALYMGKGDQKDLDICFSTSLFIHLIIGVIVVAALEIGGLWMLNSELNIPTDRMSAARWVFQLSVIGSFFSVIQTPFSAAMTAHEHFHIYAVMSIFDALAKLVVIFCLIFFSGDKLIIYAVLMLLISLVNLAIYQAYCIRNFKECRWSFKIDRTLLKEMLSFSGWGAFGHVITVVNTQGISIVLNIFFNTVMNAARGLANTVNFTITQFVAGFLTAAQPQLVKYYGAGDMQRFYRLIFNVTQYTLFILAIVAVPVILEVGYVIDLWLGNETPPYTASFVKITVICSVIYRSNMMVESGLHAIGRVRENNLYSVPVYLLSIPLVYFVLWMGWGPLSAYWAGSIPPTLSFVINLILLSKFTDFPGWRFFIDIFLKNLAFILIGAIPAYLVQINMEPGLLRFLAVCSVGVVCEFAIIWAFGLNAATRQIFRDKVLDKLQKILHKG